MKRVVVAAVLILSGCEKQQPAPPPKIEVRDSGTATPVDAGTEAEAPELPGKIRGTISFTGTPPRMPPLKRTSDPACAGMPKTEEGVLVKDGKLRNVFVRVTQNVTGAPERKLPPAVLDQRACAYHPRVLGMAYGQTLQILNSDSTLHNVHAWEGQQSTFNAPQDPGAAPIERQPTAGVIKFKCDIHPWMTAYVVVAPHRFFDVSAEDGTYEIAGLPDGEYTLETWHERYKAKVATVKVQGAAPAEADFSFSEQDRQ